MDFVLREWKIQDVTAVAKYADNPRIADHLRDAFPNPYTQEDARQYVESCIRAGDQTQLCRAIEAAGEAVGSIGIFLRDDVYHKSAELGYWLAEPFWGKGIMSRAVLQLCEEAFQRYDIVRIFAEPFAYNQGSKRVLEKAGFTLEGVMRSSVCKHGVIHDSCMYALIKSNSFLSDAV
ncbi:GNAT family protein [Diplocloster hominis]|uniref:GNAT family N-acetyltransferase n=1 Tax=Diplocloster hominis TaxID=3079010 RepID=UPI0031BB99D2